MKKSNEMVVEGGRAKPAQPVEPDMEAPLRAALHELLAEHPDIPKLLMQRLIEIAGKGKNNESLRALELLFDRLDGPLMKEIQDQITPIQVTLQNINLRAKQAGKMIEAENGGPALED